MLVLTQSQLNQAILQGAVVLNLITKEVAAQVAGTPIRMKQTFNGFLVLEFGTAPAATAPAPGAPPRGKVTKTPSVSTIPSAAADALNAMGNHAAPAAGAVADAGPPAETVKLALKAVMDNPPGLNTISKWDAAARRKAIKWTKDATQPRPTFIVPRAARGSKAATPTANATPVANGSAEPESDGMRMFDQLPVADAE